MIEERIKSLFGKDIQETVVEYTKDYLDLNTAKCKNSVSSNSNLISIKLDSTIGEKPHTIDIYKRGDYIFITDEEEKSTKRCYIIVNDKEELLTVVGYNEKSGRLAHERKKYPELIMFYSIDKCKKLFDKRLQQTDKDLFFQDTVISSNEKFDISPSDVIQVSEKQPILTMIKYAKENIMGLENIYQANSKKR